MYEHIESKHVKGPGYMCEECNIVCPTRKALRCHIGRYHQKPKVNYCWYWFNAYCTLEITQQVNMLMEKVQNVWKCKACSYENTRKTNVFEHVEAKHVESSGYSYNICGQFCKTISAYKGHFKRNHRNWSFFILIYAINDTKFYPLFNPYYN